MLLSNMIKKRAESFCVSREGSETNTFPNLDNKKNCLWRIEGEPENACTQTLAAIRVCSWQHACDQTREKISAKQVFNGNFLPHLQEVWQAVESELLSAPRLCPVVSPRATCPGYHENK